MATDRFALRVNAGQTRERYTDSMGQVWEPDRVYEVGAPYGFVGGAVAERDPATPIGNTVAPDLYRSERYGMQRFLAHVPDGRYTVSLYFSEGWGAYRIFSVVVQGRRLVRDLYVEKEAGGMNTAVVKVCPDVTVTNGRLDIVFVAQEDTSAEINGIEVEIGGNAR